MPNMTQSDYTAFLARQKFAKTDPGEVDTGTPESDIQDQIESECRRRGWYVVRSRMDKPTTNGLGVPDFIVAIDCGVTLWVEVKRPGQKLRPEQAGAQAWLGKLEHRRTVVHSLAEFLTWIETI